ncbi:uncharacterized protein KY384_002109 [Bacidia gigantensis]|uniref:uncharacterized protein n=1 Tax=Bacidia gigantensis TaxID=2732470 RepID=UPI001D054597|nr:uncharacterized protein KY384_002109 [Bacidia gigantensis]KAG8533326.1 hypothetical protein KY384_002109 [Bacidia gigantensis]
MRVSLNQAVAQSLFRLLQDPRGRQRFMKSVSREAKHYGGSTSTASTAARELQRPFCDRRSSKKDDLSFCELRYEGVAAIGFAFGHPQHSTAIREVNLNKKRAMSGALLDTQRLRESSPATPPAQAASAPTPRFRDPTFTSSPVVVPINLRNGTKTFGARPDKTIERGNKVDHRKDAHTSRPLQTNGQQTLQAASNTVENARPLHFHPKSARSSLRTGSPVPATPPGSASLSQSNSSTAPILPSFGDYNSGTPSRNKLVKRSSSQRVLTGGHNLHSTLRRPATSHQRSATLNREHFDGESPRDPVLYSSPLPHSLPVSDDFETQQWQPFFKPQTQRASRTASSSKRKSYSGVTRQEVPPTVVPDLTELPTMLLASSIGSHSSDADFGGRPSDLSQLSRPFTPVKPARSDPFTPKPDRPHSSPSMEPRSRTSFSFSDMFPSPSPLTWKMPRAGSLRNKKPPGNGGRRIVSAPHTTQAKRRVTPTENNKTLGNHTRIYASTQYDSTPSKSVPQSSNAFQRTPSSPLPPLKRLSSFQLNLPETIPSYPTTPGRRESPTRPREISLTTPLTSSHGQSLEQVRSYQLSGTHSDHASTLLGSDNENSHIVSSDEDDFDGRSSTVYDSTRTGATGSSLNGNKRPHIDAIFDESPPPKHPNLEDKVLDLKHLAIADIPGKAHYQVRQQASTRNGMDETTSVLKVPNEQQNIPFSTFKNKSSLLEYGELPGLNSNTKIGSNSKSVDESANSQQTSPHSSRPPPRALGNPESEAGFSPPKERSRSRRSTPRRRDSPSAGSPRLNPFEWSEQSVSDRNNSQPESVRPKTVHGRLGKDLRGHRPSNRRGPPALHLRSQSVPVPSDNRNHSSASKIDTWVLGGNGPSEDWDGDFDFEEPSRLAKPMNESMRPSLSSGMLVPKAILENQASVHGQFGQVKELTKLVEELKRLQQQAKLQGIMNGQAIELWREAEGIINLATLDEDEQDLLPPHSPSADFDFFDEDSPSNRRRRPNSPTPPTPPPKDDRPSLSSGTSSQNLERMPSIRSSVTPPPGSRPRKESSAKAKTVLEHIHQQRTDYDGALLNAAITQRKLPFDTTSLKDLVTRAGVVTRALKEEVRRAENRSGSPLTDVRTDQRSNTPPDPPFSQTLFKKPSPSSSFSKSPRVTQSPKSQKSPKSPKSPKSSRGSHSSVLNDNEIKGHMKIMTVV